MKITTETHRSQRYLCVLCASVVIFVFAANARAQDRPLSWKSLDVSAHLDADGTLQTT